MNRYHLMHVTEFHYDAPVSDSYNEVRLRPLHDERQSCLSFRLTTNPASRITSYRDATGNWVHQFNVLAEHRRLRVEAESVVLTHEAPPTGNGESLVEFDAHREEFLEEHYDYLGGTAYVPHLPVLLDLVTAAELACDGSVGDFAQTATNLIHERFHYVQGATHVHSSIADSLSHGAGVCQDFAHVLLGIVRMRGIPGRYVSGYLVSGAADTENAKQEEVIGGQASHAWVEVLVPGIGWMGFDPTLGEPVELRHIRVAYGRDYGDVAPVRGVYLGRAGQRLCVDVRVRPVLDDDGHEKIGETPMAIVPPTSVAERPQQQQQQ
jgi:transglutaminase-like putative cysteine protease